MAYMSQERKAQIAPVVLKICKEYGIKATMSVQNHSTLCLNIKSGGIDFIRNLDETMAKRAGDRVRVNTDGYLQVNPYWYHEHFSGVAKEFFEKVMPAMNAGNWDKSDIQTDYFNVGWYVDVNIGAWNKPYQLVM